MKKIVNTILIEMLRYENIYISEGIDPNNSNQSKECKIYHYWNFKDINYKHEPHVGNQCHD